MMTPARDNPANKLQVEERKIGGKSHYLTLFIAQTKTRRA